MHTHARTYKHTRTHTDSHTCINKQKRRRHSDEKEASFRVECHRIGGRTSAKEGISLSLSLSLILSPSVYPFSLSNLLSASFPFFISLLTNGALPQARRDYSALKGRIFFFKFSFVFFTEFSLDQILAWIRRHGTVLFRIASNHSCLNQVGDRET